MLRLLISILVAVYAIAFAFGALTAVRWPSIMMVMGWLLEDSLADGVKSVDWRQLGIAHGAPYLLASLCFYASAVSVSGRKRGAVLWYLMALVAGFPCVFLVSFEDGWWNDPSTAEGAIAGAAVGAILLLSAVYELRWRPARKAAVEDEEVDEASQREVIYVMAPPAEEGQVPQPGEVVRLRKGPVPAAIARQRASFAYHGRKMAARRKA